MKIVFMGTPEFSSHFLRHLVNGEHQIVAVVTQPDKPAGRGMQLQSPPVKVSALEMGILVLQPNSVRDADFLESLKKIDADIFVVVAFSILPKAVLATAKFGAINIHGSLLPKYRGAAPVQWAIANCEKETGLTIFLLDEKMDHGPILEMRTLPIDINDTTVTLLNKMVAPGCEALDIALKKIESKNFTPIEQNHSAASPAPKLKKEDGLIDFNLTSLQIHKRLCAFTPFPGLYTFLPASGEEKNGQKLLLRKTELAGDFANYPKINCPKNLEKGKFIIEKNEVFVGTGDGALKVLEVQSEGKKRMPAADFFRGLKN
ncbi:methionyl-tRNA formyltransferase [Fibrobacterales bacterium]|nr:methionyl-tRNA formyltransferase [Fibrobacterales bacterium]